MINFTEDLELRARYAADFVASDYGADVVGRMLAANQELHEQAEDRDLSIEEKALLVERAAGFRDAMSIITTDANMHDQDYFQETRRKIEEETQML